MVKSMFHDIVALPLWGRSSKCSKQCSNLAHPAQRGLDSVLNESNGTLKFLPCQKHFYNERDCYNEPQKHKIHSLPLSWHLASSLLSSKQRT